MSYEAARGWKLEGYRCPLCKGQAMAHPSDGGAEDEGDYLFLCEAGCVRVEVFDMESPAAYFEHVDCAPYEIFPPGGRDAEARDAQALGATRRAARPCTGSIVREPTPQEVAYLLRHPDRPFPSPQELAASGYEPTEETDEP